MNRTISTGAITSVVLALSMQAHAGGKIAVDSAAANDWAEQVNVAVNGKESREAIKDAMVNLAQNVVVDGNESAVDVSLILQATRNDSANGNYGSDVKPSYDSSGKLYCYSNCHKACHGSRNWR